MKKCKRKQGGIFLLLIKYYVIFTVIVMICGIIISSVSNLTLEKTYTFSLGLSDKEKVILNEEIFNKLNIKKIAGIDGVIEILDENNNIIFNSNKNHNKDSYTERELDFIPNYDSYNNDISIYEFVNENNEEYKLLISNKYTFDEYGDAYYDKQNSWFKILDSNLNVFYDSTGNSNESSRYTEKELGYLTQNYPSDYTLSKYTYTNNEGKNRIAIIKEKNIDYNIFYKKIDKLMNFSLLSFLLACIICIIVFGILLKKKVQAPLNKLNGAMHLLSEGKNNEPLSYSGPKEFVDICNSFNVMVNKLESSELERNKLIKDKHSMLADISHDLKTPITTIQGYAKALADGVISEEEYKKYFNIIYSKSKKLTELINIFYEYSKLEHPDFKLVFETVDLSEYLRAYVASKYEEILDNGFNIEVDIPEKLLEFKLDKVQFQRVLDNILGNSMKHNPPGTEIYVELKEVNNNYKIIIADNGTGIPKEIRDNIFSAFIVGDESRNTKQGSGLGLAITKTVVEMHGGSIKLKSSSDSKYVTVFEINLIK